MASLLLMLKLCTSVRYLIFRLKYESLLMVMMYEKGKSFDDIYPVTYSGNESIAKYKKYVGTISNHRWSLNNIFAPFVLSESSL